MSCPAFCTPVGRNELISIISKLKNNKSPGPNNIGSKLVKNNVSILVDPLIHLFNLSITTGVVPDKLKLAKVIPVYKNKGEITSPGNYRPISLLSVFENLYSPHNSDSSSDKIDTKLYNKDNKNKLF